MRYRAECTDCTSAEGIAADADVDCKASSYYHPAACLALPADDDRSSCRLGRLFQTDRVLDRDGGAFAARCGRDCSRRGLGVRLKMVSASKMRRGGCLRVMVELTRRRMVVGKSIVSHGHLGVVVSIAKIMELARRRVNQPKLRQDKFRRQNSTCGKAPSRENPGNGNWTGQSGLGFGRECGSVGVWECGSTSIQAELE